MNNIETNCAALTEEVLNEMDADNYSYRMTHKVVYEIYHSLTQFCNENYAGKYTPSIGQKFLSTKLARTPPLSKKRASIYQNSIMRLDFALSGNFHWNPVGFTKRKPYVKSCFSTIIEEYEKNLEKGGKKEKYIRCGVHLVSRFLKYAENAGITELSELTSDVIYTGFQVESDKGDFAKFIKPFLRYAYDHGLMDKDFSEVVPTCSRHKPVPSVYPPEDVEALLASIDRTKDLGKRNYCIILLAARLGLRTGDIAALKFSNIQWEKMKICLIQEKTKVPIELPLLEEIKEALIDYIDNARPKSDSQLIFLSAPHPFVTPLNCSAISTFTSRQLAIAGIDTTGKKRGLHALRSSLASQLLKEGNSYPTIQRVLGHTSSNAAKHYIRIDIDRLRKCAVEVPEIQSEKLKDYFKGGSRNG